MDTQQHPDIFKDLAYQQGPLDNRLQLIWSFQIRSNCHLVFQPFVHLIVPHLNMMQELVNQRAILNWKEG